ncbi:MAG: flagellar assembly protein FliW [Leptolyngbya sp. PLA2]|nr:flagellar assembly protein FliW [Leptolyngbya sp.]MCE7972287.1 flagellar assembly protein FliW [Leptolyngbya sp. PL-A2]MCQ3939521.1 flagellar assembly protein FliW [cyanobacterium CYA1]MCZ7632223.1 flagellar assembly protein FliW [Phycisphaerales bacterium]MDL1903778.1 flagellar assembly protein FliW [Synechococcales cyanobacterium CNB]GIK18504.1 MAG: flagellar assembly factor FliW [Planctomycetota bacterium]
MEVRTTRFGVIEIAEDRVITFPRGLLGFPEHTRYCLLEPGEDACFFWLQSLDDPELAFVVTDPSLFVPDYSVPIRPEQMAELGLSRLEDSQVFVIVNKVDQTLTGNLQGPLVINTLTRAGEQLVLAEKRWTTRHALMKVAPAPRAASA